MADLYAPQGVDLGGVAPPEESGMTQYEKSGLSRKIKKKNVKQHLKMEQDFKYAI